MDDFRQSVRVHDGREMGAFSVAASERLKKTGFKPVLLLMYIDRAV